MRHLNILSIVLLSILSLTLSAQSISGNVNAFANEANLGYANVDIYKGTELIAAVLADKDGNFKVNLDTGMYRAEIIYAGYKKITQKVHVTDDEKAHFSMKEDLESKYKPSKDKASSAESADDYGTAYSYDMELEESISDVGVRERSDLSAISSSPLLMKRDKKSIVSGDYRFPS
jgi:hypothetical protein